MNGAAKQAHTRSEDHVQVRCGFELVKELRDRGERCGEVGIPEADVLAGMDGGMARCGKCGIDAIANGLRLPAILLLIQDGDAVLVPLLSGVVAHGIEYGKRSVGATVVDEEEADGMIGCEEVEERCRPEAVGFVVAGHHDGADAACCRSSLGHRLLWFHIP